MTGQVGQLGVGATTGLTLTEVEEELVGGHGPDRCCWGSDR